MTDQRPTAEPITQHYEITIQEQLPADWSAWFDGLTITPGPGGTTRLAGAVRDVTALYGLIAKLRDLGLTLVAVTPDLPAVNQTLDARGDATHDNGEH